VYYARKDAEKHGTLAALWYSEAVLEGSRDKRWSEEVQGKLLSVGITPHIQNFLFGVNCLCRGIISDDTKKFEQGLNSFCEKSEILNNSEGGIKTQFEKNKPNDFESAVRFTMQTVQGMLSELPESLQVYFQKNKAEIFKGLCELYRTEW
jgi:hypothetical protein